jgi:uncharacterized protein DUF1501
MLAILGKHNQARGFCDRITRRGFLQIGGAALGGIALNEILALDAAAGVTGSNKAIINVYLPGGPPHLDMWDLKPDAPAEIRGDYKPISTIVPGIQICELFPKIAAMMDKFAIIRTICDSDGDHDGYQCMTGRKKRETAPGGGWPTAGGWVSRLAGPANEAIPANMALVYPTKHKEWGDPYTSGFLGAKHNAFNALGKKPGEKPQGMVLQGITLERLRDRDRLRESFDRFRRDADVASRMQSIDAYTQQALGILTTSKLGDALDLSKEDPKILERYGKSDEAFRRDGAPRMVESFCIARRLVEAGARYVALNFSRWDWHGGDGMNFVESKVDFPLLDSGLSALVTDLHERGLAGDVSVVVWGEFGRTPKLNKMNSRDHWPKVNAALLAGGGMRTGQVIGETNKYAEEPRTRPVKFQEIFGTLYHQMGLDAHRDRIFDGSGTPRYPVDSDIEPIRELI